MEKYYLNEKIDLNSGFILSYGESDELYPAGIYQPSYVYKQAKKDVYPITFDTMLTDEDAIIFSRYGDESNLEDFIIISAENSLALLNKDVIDFNSEQISYNGKDVVEVCEFIEKIIEMYNDTSISIDSLINFNMDQVEANRILNDEVGSTNYSIMPVSMPCKVKRLVKTR